MTTSINYKTPIIKITQNKCIHILLEKKVNSSEKHKKRKHKKGKN